MEIKKSRISKLQQNIYEAIVERWKQEGDIDVKKNFKRFETPSPNTGFVKFNKENREIILDKQPLFNVANALNVPIKDAKNFEAELFNINNSDWRSLNILTSKGVTVKSLFGNIVHFDKLLVELIVNKIQRFRLVF